VAWARSLGLGHHVGQKCSCLGFKLSHGNPKIINKKIIGIGCHMATHEWIIKF